MHTKPLQFSIVLLSIFLIFSCENSPKNSSKDDKEEANRLGTVSLNVTGNKEAQNHFVNGLLLLHSFEYEDAREEFRKAQEADPTMAMAFWGDAMTFNHTLWQRQERDSALNVLNKLHPDVEQRIAMAGTPLEKDFMRAVHLLYNGETKYERDVAYRDFMEELSKKYPDHHEVKAFYAISILGSSRKGREEALYEKAARIAQGIMEENPNHPGALHYLIHSYDDPKHAHLAHEAADRYAKVAPDAAHALHMPSHIYVALGAWQDVVQSNIASWNASVNRMTAKGLDNSARNYHAYNWLQYGLLQRGEYALADSLLRQMVQYTRQKDEKPARSYLIAMKGAQLVETGQTGKLDSIEFETEDLNIVSRAAYNFINGYTAWLNNDRTALQKIISDMRLDREKASIRVGKEGFALCGAGGFASRPPDQQDVDMAQCMELELEAFLAILNNNDPLARQKFQEACRVDDGISYNYGPPDIMKPVYEAYAEYLLSQGEYRTAIEMYNKALGTHPGRLHSLLGKLEAARKINSKKEVDALVAMITQNTEGQSRREIL